MRTAPIVAIVLLASACSVELPSGAVRCDPDSPSPCPEGYLCRADPTGVTLCYDQALVADSGPLDTSMDTSMDSGVADADATDSSMMDTEPVDAGFSGFDLVASGAGEDRITGIVLDEAASRFFIGGFGQGPTELGGAALITGLNAWDGFVAEVGLDGVIGWTWTSTGLGTLKINDVAFAGGRVYACGDLENTETLDATGVMRTSMGGIDALVVALDASSGTFIWTKRFGGSLRDTCAAIVADNDRVCFGGGFIGNVPFDGLPLGASGSLGGRDGYVICVNHRGERQWGARAGDTLNDEFFDLALGASSDKIYAIGTGTHPISTDVDVTIALFTAPGSPRVFYRFDDTPQVDADRGLSILRAGDTVYATGTVAGTSLWGGTWRPPLGTRDGFIAGLSLGLDVVRSFDLVGGVGASTELHALATAEGRVFAAGHYTGPITQPFSRTEAVTRNIVGGSWSPNLDFLDGTEFDLGGGGRDTCHDLAYTESGIRLVTGEIASPATLPHGVTLPDGNGFEGFVTTYP